MALSSEQLQLVMTGTQESRVEALRQLLSYPLKQRDREGSRFWFLRPGLDEDEAEDTCPIAVGFYSELNGLTHGQILRFLTTEEQQKEIYGHYIQRIVSRKFEENPELLTVGLEDQSWSGYVKERLLPRVFGFELLMATYAIAHLKLGLFLEETGYEFNSGRRLGVYLTNTLDEAIQKSESLFEEFIAEESDQAAEIKRYKPVMVVVGNPPYSVNSANKSEWVTTLVRDAYYPKDEMKEQNPKMLLDDYVKFLRFGQWRIDQTKQGILAFITNHGYLDNPTFRGMRRSLEQSFDRIYVMDLHGNTKKREVSPDNSKDENVFDIQQGVSISLMLKKGV